MKFEIEFAFCTLADSRTLLKAFHYYYLINQEVTRRKTLQRGAPKDFADSHRRTWCYMAAGHDNAILMLWESATRWSGNCTVFNNAKIEKRANESQGRWRTAAGCLHRWGVRRLATDKRFLNLIMNLKLQGLSFTGWNTWGVGRTNPQNSAAQRTRWLCKIIIP